MKVLIVGNGGREHALAWKVAKSARITRVFVAPGNAGTAREPKVQNVAIDVLDFPALADLARREDIGLTIVGPRRCRWWPAFATISTRAACRVSDRRRRPHNSRGRRHSPSRSWNGIGFRLPRIAPLRNWRRPRHTS